MDQVTEVQIDEYQQWFQQAVLSRRPSGAAKNDCAQRLELLRERMQRQIRAWNVESAGLRSQAADKTTDTYQRLNRLRIDTHGCLLSWKLEAEILRGNAARLSGDEELKAGIVAVCDAIESHIRTWEAEILHVKRETERVEAEAIWESYRAAILVAADAAATSLDNLYKHWGVVIRQW